MTNNATAPWDETTLTPTQDLIMEVLQARLRLGEQCWSFSSKLRKQIADLAEKGEISYKESSPGILLVFPANAQKLIATPYKIPLLNEYVSKTDVTNNYTPKVFAKGKKVKAHSSKSAKNSKDKKVKKNKASKHKKK